MAIKSMSRNADVLDGDECARLRDSLSRHRHEDGDPWDDGPLPDLTSGIMWTATGVLGAAVLALPGSDRDHVGDRARHGGLRGRLGAVLALDGARAAAA